MENNVLYIDVEAGMKRVVYNIKLYIKLLGKFKDDPNFSEIDEALAAGNMEKAQNAAHALKGLAANLSLIELQDQCAELEAQIKTGTVNPEQVTAVKNTYAQTMIEVDKVIARYV
jgi:HPt (histidine-containing phosphotransfer) domain-containing protein